MILYNPSASTTHINPCTYIPQQHCYLRGTCCIADRHLGNQLFVLQDPPKFWRQAFKNPFLLRQSIKDGNLTTKYKLHGTLCYIRTVDSFPFYIVYLDVRRNLAF